MTHTLTLSRRPKCMRGRRSLPLFQILALSGIFFYGAVNAGDRYFVFELTVYLLTYDVMYSLVFITLACV